MPLITVTMPAHNSRDTIISAVRSTLRALPKDAELVVFDDASYDGTSELIDKITDKRLRIMESTRSVGSGEARQRVLDATDSQFVANVDSDDLSLPWRFETPLRELARADFHFGSAVTFRKGLHSLRPLNFRPYTNFDSRVALTVRNVFVHSTMTARRRSLETAGGYSNLRRAQDYELWLRAASLGMDMIRTGAPLLAYRFSDAQVTGSSDYVTEVRQQTTLRTTYLKHVASVFPDLSLTDNDLQSKSALRQLHLHVLHALPEMSFLNRRHYARNLAPLSYTMFGVGASLPTGSM